VLTSALSAAFAILLARRFVTRRAAYYGVWTLALAWYALSTGAQAVGGLSEWTPLLFRLWYLSGAIGVAAYLGAGTLYLHRGRAFGFVAVACILLGGLPALAEHATPIFACVVGACLACTIALVRNPRVYPHVALSMLILASLAAGAIIFTAPVDVSALPARADTVVTGQPASAEVRLLTPAFNIAGASMVILGALASGLAFARARRDPRRVASNGLIALGALVPSFASGLTRFGLTSGFFLGQLIGVSCLLAGFLLATAPRVALHPRESSIPHAPRSPILSSFSPRRHQQ
jgi:hypothetical protein